MSIAPSSPLELIAKSAWRVIIVPREPHLMPRHLVWPVIVTRLVQAQEFALRMGVSVSVVRDSKGGVVISALQGLRV